VSRVESLCRSGIEIRHVPGNHVNMYEEPHTTTLAAEINAVISKLDI
jgi:thioesterase domain-containing protein